jgi:hypothetical protein
MRSANILTFMVLSVYEWFSFWILVALFLLKFLPRNSAPRISKCGDPDVFGILSKTGLKSRAEKRLGSVPE